MLVRIMNFFRNLTLSQRFMLASLFILLAGMLGIGAWVGKQIETGVIHRTGATTALYVDSFVAPNLQELGEADELPSNRVDKLTWLLQNTPLGQQLVAFKVWDTRGKLLYSTDESTIGRTYPMHEGMLRARLGEVVSEVSPLEEVENAPLGAVYDRLLETYSPVWLSETDQIIAVAEFYQLTDDLDREIGALKQRSWLVVGMAIFFMYLLLAGFVRSASDTITQQKSELGRKVVQLTDLLGQNQELHGRVQRAAASVALLNESYLRRVGSELHDGPAQELGLSLLKLDALAGQIESSVLETAPAAALEQVGEIQSSLENALKEMRAIATGLSLPQLNELSLPETIIRAVRAHERRTGTQVTLDLGPVPAQSALPLKFTVFRLVQEALNNAFRHTGGALQRVSVGCEQDHLAVEISDQGPGFDPMTAASREGRLGISGMRERVESLGGQFEIVSATGQGTLVRARLPLNIAGDIQL